MRLIDADALQKMVTDLAPHPHDKWETIGIWHLIDMARTLTLDDLRPKGRWVGLEYDGYADGVPVYNLWECSECGAEASGEDVPETHSFCHGCGADMRGGWEGGHEDS